MGGQFKPVAMPQGGRRKEAKGCYPHYSPQTSV